jgi:muramidase (phage lysozyme)
MALPQNQIRPQAQPLSTFIQPARRNVAGPAGPIEIPRVQQINVIGQASGGDAPGVNRFQQVAQALAPFNQQLTQLMGTGLQVYAQAEVQKGVNEALRAKALLEEQQAQSGAEYAAENRKLAQADPIAALAMDTVNPFRQAGRQRTLARLAGAEMRTSLLNSYRANPDLVLINPGTPEGAAELGRFKAAEVTKVAQKYGVDQSSPGFTQFVAPEVNQAWDRITEVQWQDRKNYLTSTIPRTATAEILGIYQAAVSLKQIEVFDPDGRQRIVRQEDGPEVWEQALTSRFQLVLSRIRDETGLPGQATQLVQETVANVLAQAEAFGLGQLRRVMAFAQVGPPNADGQPGQLAGMMFPDVFLDQEIKYGEVKYKRDQRRREDLSRGYQDDLAQLTYSMPDGPERLAAIEKLRASEDYKGLGNFEKLELEQKSSATIDAVRNLGRSSEGVEQLLLDMDGRYGTAWDPSQADAEIEAALAAAPDDKKAELRRQYAAIRRRNNEQKASPTAPQANAVIERTIKANLRAAYPNSVTEAALRGVSVESVMAGWTDANVAESARRQFSAFQSHINNRIAEEQGKLGRPLTPAEVTQVSSRAVEEYGKSTPSARQYLFPGVGGVPGAQGAPAQPAAAGQQSSGPPPGTKPFTGKTYPSSQLDNIPDRRALLQSWRNQPVLDAQSVVNEGNRILNGQQPSAALQRFAREAGTTPGQLINRHLDYYPGMEMTPQERQRLMRDGRQAQGAASNAQNTAARRGNPTPGPVAAAGGWLLDMLLGAQPAVAAQQRPLPSAVGMGGGQRVATRGGGGGGAGIAARNLPPQTRALLRTIRFAEGTDGPDGYRTMFTGRKFNDLSRHPRIVNSSNGLSSDAAGAYQFLSTTWNSRLVGGGAMTPERQDMGAVRLVRNRGVDPSLPGGFTVQVADRLAPEWASFPTARTGTSYYGQGGKSFAQLKAYYERALREEMGR